jgi:hypothetical protein
MLAYLAASVARFLNAHPEHRAELLPELDPETAGWRGDVAIRRGLRRRRLRRSGDVRNAADAPTEELIRVLANGGDARWCWSRQLLAIRKLDTIEVAPWA